MLRRLVGVLMWAGTLATLALGLPTPWGPPHLGVTVVSGPSMLPTYDPGDLVVTWRTGAYPAGTPVVYGIPAGETGAGMNVVHRVVSEEPDGTHVMQGDNNETVDPWLPRASDVRGEVVLRVPHGGRVLRVIGSPMLLALFSGGMVGLAVFDWARKRGGPRDGGGAGGPRAPGGSGRPVRRRKRHRRPTPVAARAALLCGAVALAVGVVPASAAPIGTLTSADLYATALPASIATNPVSYEQTLTSETATQYCATVVVTNHSDAAVQWEVTLDVSAAPYDAESIASSYNATTVSFTATAWRVRGVDWNAALGAGQSYTWGYCANRPAGGLTDATATATITSGDAASYCATVTVSTASTTWLRWKVTIGHATTGLTDPVYWLAAAPTNTYGSATVSFDVASGSWVVQGSGSNEHVRSGSTATFGYCAPTAAAAPFTDATVSVSISNQDSTSYCADMTVSTTSTSWIRWRAVISHTTPGLTNASYWLGTVPTDITNAATIAFDASTGTWQVKGVAFNQLIKAGTPATWRFCGAKNTGPDAYVDASVSVTVTSDWGAGYCTNVTVSTTSPDLVTWRGTIDHATPGVTSPGYWLTSLPSSYYGVESISFDAATGTWRFKGLSYNSQVKAGSPVTFGYCR